MAVQRPLKEGNVRTYQEKVVLGFPDILASEMDADLDLIYASWNGGPAGPAGGRLTGTYPNPGLAADVEQTVAGTFSSHNVGEISVGPLGGIRTRLGGTNSYGYISTNNYLAPENLAQASWFIYAYTDVNDIMQLIHRNAGAAAGANTIPVQISPTGDVTAQRYVTGRARACIMGAPGTQSVPANATRYQVGLSTALSDPGGMSGGSSQVHAPVNTIVQVSAFVGVSPATTFNMLAMQWTGTAWANIAAQSSRDVQGSVATLAATDANSYQFALFIENFAVGTTVVQATFSVFVVGSL